MQRTAPSRSYHSPYWLFSLLAVAIMLIVTWLLMSTLNWGWLWSYLIGVNIATLALYGYDKAAAGSGGRRVPETVLHGAEFLGGTPAALVGQQLFHHKRRKGSYMARFWLIAAMQAVVVFVIWQMGWV